MDDTGTVFDNWLGYGLPPKVGDWVWNKRGLWLYTYKVVASKMEPAGLYLGIVETWTPDMGDIPSEDLRIVWLPAGKLVTGPESRQWNGRSAF